MKIDGKILVDSNVTPPNIPSIDSTYRANPDAGFSIITYEGPHGYYGGNVKEVTLGISDIKLNIEKKGVSF